MILVRRVRWVETELYSDKKFEVIDEDNYFTVGTYNKDKKRYIHYLDAIVREEGYVKVKAGKCEVYILGGIKICEKGEFCWLKIKEEKIDNYLRYTVEKVVSSHKIIELEILLKNLK